MVDSFLKVNQNNVKWTIFLELIDICTPNLFLFYRNNPALIIDLKIFKLIGYANIQNIENKNFESIYESSLLNNKLKLTVPKGELEDVEGLVGGKGITKMKLPTKKKSSTNKLKSK